MIYEIKGDLTKAPQIAIGHQTNCQLKMGAGIALYMRRAFPKHYEDFMNDNRTPKDKLGKVICTKINNKFIYGIYGQLYYGRESGKVYTDYDAQKKAIELMIINLVHSGIDEIALPFKMGCVNAGGDWNVVYKNLEELSNKYNIDIYLYRLE